MKKIIELAEKVVHGGTKKDIFALLSCIDTRKMDEESPITREWLRAHGFVETGSKPGTFYTRWGHYNTIRLSFDDGSCDFSIEKSTGDMYFDRVNKHNATIADLYDACELCGIELN